MRFRVVLLLLFLVREWDVAEADCSKELYSNAGGVTFLDCPPKNNTEESRLLWEPEGTKITCEHTYVFEEKECQWFNAPDDVEYIEIVSIDIPRCVKVIIENIVDSHDKCKILKLTKGANGKDNVIIKLKPSDRKFRIRATISTATIRFMCKKERECAKMKMTQDDRIMKRIVNGEVVKEPHMYVFMARLQIYYSKVNYDYNKVSGSDIMSSYLGTPSGCGGSIIHANWILTAAHCVLLEFEESGTTYYLVGVNVILGDHYTNVTDDGEITIWVKPQNVHPHNKYNDPSSHNNDIALLKVESIEPNKDFRFPICLAPSYMDTLTFLDDCDVTSAGWGVFDAKKPRVSSVCLREGFFTVENNDVCAAKYKEVQQPDIITSNMICTTDDITNTCYGDSGGPVFCKDRYQTFLQVGVNSFNKLDKVTLWKHDFPQVGARVTRYIGWINDIIAPDTLP